jgi:Fic family protein
MEPLVLSEGSRLRPALTDLALELAQRSAGFRRSLPASLLMSLATLVRAMNCYYSNLIEGHDTHPVDIERALQSDYSRDAKKRDLQLEAKAHIGVQEWIDEGGLKDRSVTVDSIREIHRRFCAALPEDLLCVENPDTHERMQVIPGELRTRDVRVGDHVAISALAVPRFLARFEEVYRRLGKTETILAAAAAHHRLTWIHPFLDGNGRVARLMSHATLLDALDTGAILEAVLYRGELPRGDAAGIVGTGDRQARRVVSALIEQCVLVSESSRAPLRLAFPAALASRWMPGLLPDQPANS